MGQWRRFGKIDQKMSSEIPAAPAYAAIGVTCVFPEHAGGTKNMANVADIAPRQQIKAGIIVIEIIQIGLGGVPQQTELRHPTCSK